MENARKDSFPGTIRIGVLADTHLSDCREARLFMGRLVEQYFQGVSLILHAGDIVVPELLQALLPVPVYAVRGNMDPASVETPPKRLISVGGVTIGLIHGWGAPAGIVERIRPEFSQVSLDCLVYGHTHEPCCRLQGGVLLFNPGSACDRRRMAYESVGLLEIEKGRIHGKILPLSG